MASTFSRRRDLCLGPALLSGAVDSVFKTGFYLSSLRGLAFQYDKAPQAALAKTALRSFLDRYSPHDPPTGTVDQVGKHAGRQVIHDDAEPALEVSIQPTDWKRFQYIE